MNTVSNKTVFDPTAILSIVIIILCKHIITLSSHLNSCSHLGDSAIRARFLLHAAYLSFGLLAVQVYAVLCPLL